MISEYLKALSLILFAEMGDKTQIIAMTFALRYTIKDILLGVALGAGINHAIAIILGVMLSKVINFDIVQILAGTVFVIFAYLSLSSEEDEEEDKISRKMSPILTVAIAFFIGELGDKTQLSALALSLNSKNPFIVLLGTTSGMVLTSLFGIIIGGKLGKKIPEFQLKIASFLIFLFFGLEKIMLSKYLTDKLGNTVKLIVLSLIFIGALYRFYKFYTAEKAGKITVFKKHAEELYEMQHNILKNLDKLCLNENRCNQCIGDKCIINVMRKITKESIENNEELLDDSLEEIKHLITDKRHDKEIALEIVEDLKMYLEKFPGEKDNKYIKFIEQTAQSIINRK